MMEAITYGNLLLKLGSTVLSVYDLAIHEEPGRHGRLSASAQAEEGAKDYLLYEEGGEVVLYAVLEDSIQPLFYGIVTRMEAAAKGGRCEVFLEAVTESYLMDIAVQDRSFQDTAMTFHKLIEKIMEPYMGSRILVSVPDEAMGHIAVQYQETDWAFLNRMLSGCGAAVFVDSTMPGICLRMGNADTNVETCWEDLPYTITRDTAPVNVQKELKGQICYTVEADDVFPLGEKLQYRGQEVYIGKIERYIERGILINEYRLYFKEGLVVTKYFNPYLGGISINGTVTEIKRSQLRVRMETDAPGSYQEQYFFPFSTVAASPDGGGWYCMPNKGDPVRIFFPTEDEQEAYAISNIQAESSPSGDSPISNPDLKDITTPDGKTVKFIKGGIQVSVGKEKGIMTVTNDGKVSIKSDEDIMVYAGSVILFSAEGKDGEIELKAGTQIQLANDAGHSICITEDTVKIHASTVESN